MHAKYCNNYGIPSLRLSSHPIVGPTGYIEVFPLGESGDGECCAEMAVAFPNGMKPSDIGQWATVLHVADRIAHGESYMLMGDEGKAVVEQEQLMWARVKEIEKGPQ